MCNELNLEMWLIASQRTDSDFNLQDVLGVICLFSPESVEGKVGDVLVCFRRTEPVRFLRIIASLDQDNLAASAKDELDRYVPIQTWLLMSPYLVLNHFYLLVNTAWDVDDH